MLGHKLFQILRQRFKGVLATVRQDPATGPLAAVELLHGEDVMPGVEVTEFDTLRAKLQAWRPAFVVNCVGVVKQRDAAHSPIPSIMINALLPHRLAAEVSGWGGRLIHFSTDCVFSGRKGRYREDDPSDAEDLYGRSKYLGEVTVPNALTLRTSIIGRELAEHRSLLDWFLSQNGKKVRGFRRVIYSGITTNEMAEVVTRVIRDCPHLTGLYQVVSEPISKYELLGLIRDAYGLDLELEADDREVSDRSMVGERFRQATGYNAPSWPELVRQLSTDPTPYREWGTSVF